MDSYNTSWNEQTHAKKKMRVSASGVTKSPQQGNVMKILRSKQTQE